MRKVCAHIARYLVFLHSLNKLPSGCGDYCKAMFIGSSTYILGI